MDTKQDELIGYLGRLGFTKETFKNELGKKIKSATQYFTIQYYDIRGKSEMWYKLHFELDYQFRAYRLQKFDAVLRPMVNMDGLTINGISVPELDKRMQAIDWEAYFRHDEKLPQQTGAAEVIINTLRGMAGAMDPDGVSIVPLLQYKYWPPEIVKLYNKGSFPEEFTVHRTFSPYPCGMCNTTLAFHILNGNHEKLFDALLTPQFDQVVPEEFYVQAENILSEEPV